MNTCVLCFRRRNALEWTILSRSRWKGVRWSESGSGSARTAGYERVASGESDSSSRSIRSRNEVRASWAIGAPRLWHLPVRWPKGGRPDVELVEQEAARKLRLAARVERLVGHVVGERVALLPRSGDRAFELVDRGLALLRARVAPVLAVRDLERDAEGLRRRGLPPAARDEERRGRDQGRSSSPSHDTVLPTIRQLPVSSVSLGAPDAWAGSWSGPPPPSCDGFSGLVNHGQSVGSYESFVIEPAHGPSSPPSLPG